VVPERIAFAETSFKRMARASGGKGTALEKHIVLDAFAAYNPEKHVILDAS